MRNKRKRVHDTNKRRESTASHVCDIIETDKHKIDLDSTRVLHCPISWKHAILLVVLPHTDANVALDTIQGTKE
jgi:hypothetical protein